MDKAIIYKGPSLIDHSPIVVIATYSDRNTKTGGMVQTYILATMARAQSRTTARAETSRSVAIVNTAARPTPTRRKA